MTDTPPPGATPDVTPGSPATGPSASGGLSWLPSRSYGLKLLLVCALALAMTIPAMFVFGVVNEREMRARDVTSEIGELRGGTQTFAGPMIVAPFKRQYMNQDGVNWTSGAEGFYVVHADTGHVVAQLTSEVLRRSIYQVPVYEADLEFTADFDLAAARAGVGDRQVDWSRARVVLGATDLRGARESALIFFDGGDGVEAEPASDLTSVAGLLQLVAAPLDDMLTRDRLEVRARLVFSGSQRFSILPFAKTTDVEIAADWPHPSFEGGFLPDERDVRDDGFDASWRVPFLARGAAAAGDAPGAGFNSLLDRELAVRFVQPTDVYSSVGRALKYALMFVGFVFLAFFLFEVTSAARVHAAQYVLIGLAQAIFYLLLLALAEHVGFTIAFVIAAGLTVGATSLYAGAAYGSRAYTVRAAFVFTGVYGLLYVLMRLEDYALLVGAFASFAAVAATMYMTRTIDWYGGVARK